MRTQNGRDGDGEREMNIELHGNTLRDEENKHKEEKQRRSHYNSKGRHSSH